MTADPALQASNAARVALEEVAGLVGAAVAALETELANAQRDVAELVQELECHRAKDDTAPLTILIRLIQERAEARADADYLHRRLGDAQQEIARWAMDLRAAREQNAILATDLRVSREVISVTQDDLRSRVEEPGVRWILGAKSDETTEDAARRVVDERTGAKMQLQIERERDLDGGIGASEFRRRKLAEIRARLAELGDDHLVDVVAWLGAGRRG